jgi:hypothetical protein
MAEGDQCAPVRLFVATLDKWLSAIEAQYPGVMQSQFSDTPAFVDSVKGINKLLSEHFIIPAKGAAEAFVQTTEISSERLLTNHINSEWKHFSVIAQEPLDRCAVATFVTCMDRWDHYIKQPACHPLLAEAYPSYFRTEWHRVLTVLITCEFVSAEAIAMLWHVLEDFMLKQQRRHGIPACGGWWTDIDEGQFRPLRPDEITEEIKKAHWNDDSTGSGIIPGSFESCVSELFCRSLTEDGAVRIVDIKYPGNKRCTDIIVDVTQDIWEFKKGTVVESRILEVLSHALNGIDALLDMSAAATTRNERRKIQQRGTRKNTQKAEEVMHWAVSLAQIILNEEPSATIKRIAKVIETPEGRERIAAQLTDPKQQAKFRQSPPRPAKYRTIRDKLTLALDEGLLVVPSPRLRT